jgi:hypothetical protein
MGSPGIAIIGYPPYWYEAGGPRGLFTVQILNNNVLELKGISFDKVVWMSSVMLRSDFGLNPDLWSQDIHTNGEPSLDSLWTAASQELTLPEEDFTLTLVGGYPGNESDQCNLKRHRTEFDAYRRLVRSSLAKTSASSPIEVDPEVVKDASFIVDHIGNSASGMRLILTVNGRIGLAPGGATEIGDMCCIFLGATVPFILKPSREGRHKLVGDCYIHGVMAGELMEQMQSGKYTAEQILLD